MPALVAAAGVIFAGMAAPLAVVPTAHAAAACVTPEVRDVMISQGLPSYKRLVRGKTTLARYFLSAPNCAPEGSVIRVTGGSLDVVSQDGVSAPTLATVPLVATLPMPPVGPSSSSPVVAAESDPMFVIPGSTPLALENAPATVGFVATIDFESTYQDGTKETGRLVVTNRPSGQPVQAVIEKSSHPLRVLTVAMGDAGTEVAPTTYSTQFPAAARSALANGMSTVSRSLPLADGVSDLLVPTGGLRYSLSAGMVNLNRYMQDGVYCGTGAEFAAVEEQLLLTRTNWNSMNPAAYADRVYGAVWEGISTGPTTGGPVTCVDGYARIGGEAAWGRVIDATATRPGVSGPLATMELMHTTGGVPSKDTRYDGGYHSLNTEADVTAPERAWNTSSRTWIRNDRSALRFLTSGWYDDNTLLEKQDWDRLLCQLTPDSTAGTCPDPGLVGVAAASVTPGASFFVTGVTDGTPAGTRAHTYLDDDTNYERPEAGSAYRFVQRNALGAIVADDGLPVRQEDSHHDGSAKGAGQTTHSSVGTFGVAFPAENDTQRIQIYKGDPTAGGVLLYERMRNAPPQFLGASVERRTVTVTATDEFPEDLRLDLFLQCPHAISPMANAVEPTVVGRTAVFVTSYDTTLGCPAGRLLYRVSDGYLVSSDSDATDGVGNLTGTAAIYTPALGAEAPLGRVLGLSGTGRDAADRPADVLDWSIKGPSYPTETLVASGQYAEYRLAPDLEPGTYELRLTARSSSTPPVVLATATRSIVVLADDDLDGIPNRDEGPDKTCYAAGAALDPSNAAIDSDLDGFANINDLRPCESTTTVGVTFRPESLLKSSSGVPVTVELSGSPVDLRTLTAADLQIVQVAGYRLSQPFVATSLSVKEPTSGTAKFDRGALSDFLAQHQLLGYTPVFVAAPSHGLRGVDPASPRVFP